MYGTDEAIKEAFRRYVHPSFIEGLKYPKDGPVWHDIQKNLESMMCGTLSKRFQSGREKTWPWLLGKGCPALSGYTCQCANIPEDAANIRRKCSYSHTKWYFPLLETNGPIPKDLAKPLGILSVYLRSLGGHHKVSYRPLAGGTQSVLTTTTNTLRVLRRISYLPSSTTKKPLSSCT